MIVDAEYNAKEEAKLMVDLKEACAELEAEKKRNDEYLSTEREVNSIVAYIERSWLSV